MQSCKYFGQTGNVAKLVKDTCPPPLQRGAYYFTLDLDAGQSSEVVLQQAQLLSPADAMCDPESGVCTASTGPGYDLYVAKDCIPGPGAHGLRVPKSLPNEGQSTRKPIALSATSFQRFYVAVRQKGSVSAGDTSCSLALLPGFVESGMGQSCSITDFTPNATSTAGIQWCTPEMAPIPPALVVLTVLAACFAAALVFLCMHRGNQRRAARLMCEEAEQNFRDSLAQRSIRQETAIKHNAIAVEEAVLVRQGSHAFVGAELKEVGNKGSPLKAGHDAGYDTHKSQLDSNIMSRGWRGGGESMAATMKASTGAGEAQSSLTRTEARALSMPLSGTDVDLHSLRATLRQPQEAATAGTFNWPATSRSRRGTGAAQESGAAGAGTETMRLTRVDIQGAQARLAAGDAGHNLNLQSLRAGPDKRTFTAWGLNTL